MIKITYVDLDNKYKIISQEVEINHFPDGTLLLKTNNMNINQPIEIEWYYENDAELFMKRKHDNYIEYLEYIKLRNEGVILYEQTA